MLRGYRCGPHRVPHFWDRDVNRSFDGFVAYARVAAGARWRNRIAIVDQG